MQTALEEPGESAKQAIKEKMYVVAVAAMRINENGDPRVGVDLMEVSAKTSREALQKDYEEFRETRFPKKGNWRNFKRAAQLVRKNASHAGAYAAVNLKDPHLLPLSLEIIQFSGEFSEETGNKAYDETYNIAKKKLKEESGWGIHRVETIWYEGEPTFRSPQGV